MKNDGQALNNFKTFSVPEAVVLIFLKYIGQPHFVWRLQNFRLGCKIDWYGLFWKSCVKNYMG